MTYFLLSYLAVGLIFGWCWYFRHVRIGAESGEYLFYLVLVIVWPFPFATEVMYKWKR